MTPLWVERTFGISPEEVTIEGRCESRFIALRPHAEPLHGQWGRIPLLLAESRLRNPPRVGDVKVSPPWAEGSGGIPLDLPRDVHRAKKIQSPGDREGEQFPGEVGSEGPILTVIPFQCRGPIALALDGARSILSGAQLPSAFEVTALERLPERVFGDLSPHVQCGIVTPFGIHPLRGHGETEEAVPRFCCPIRVEAHEAVVG